MGSEMCIRDRKNIHEELALLIAAEGGKPLIDARVEVTRAIDGVETCANDLGNVIVICKHLLKPHTCF